MSRIILMAMMLAVTVAGCNRFPDLTIQVVSNLAPDDNNCSVTADQESTIGRGRYDLLLPRNDPQRPRDYMLTPRIESYIVDLSLETQAPQGNIQITGFDVTIKLPDGTVPVLSGGLPNPYRVTSTAVIPPSPAIGGVSAGSAFAPVIPGAYHDALVDLVNQSGFNSIVLDVRANGTTSGGFSQQSPPFSWPIDFCVGCMAFVCEEPAQLYDGLGCFPGQDGWGYCGEIVPAAEPAP